MLLSADNWARDPFIPAGPEGRYFFLLTDGMPTCHRVERPRLGSFCAEVANALRYDLERTSMQAAIPPVNDFLHQGIECEKVVIFTEAVSRVPIPLGRLLPPQTLVLLDQRAILRGFDWVMAERGYLSLAALQQRYADFVPPFFKLDIQGGVWEPGAIDTTIQVSPGLTLCVSFVEDLPSPSETEGSMWHSRTPGWHSGWRTQHGLPGAPAWPALPCR